jgi:hypothetical protein
MKKWLTGGTLQGVMGQVVGCGVVNVMVGLSVYKFAYCIRLVVHVQLFIISFVLFCYRLTVDVTESGTQFLQRELIMFVRSVHYSDYLEQDLCIQDDYCYRLYTHFTVYYVKSIGAWQYVTKNLCIT